MLTFLTTWTDEKLERCRALWAQGWSAGQISADLGISRNAILGKIWRQKWPSPAKPHSTKADRTMTPRAPRIRVTKRTHSAAQVVATVLPPPDNNYQKSFAEDGAKVLMDLEPSDCRFVLGDRDFQFCAAESADGFCYCPQHVRIVYQR